MRDQFEDAGAVFRRRGGGVKVPFEVGLLERKQIGAGDAQAVVFAEAGPRAGSQEAMMAGIAEFFHLVQPFLRFGLVVFHAPIDEQEPPAGPQHTRRLADKGFRRAEMVRRDAAGHEVEIGVGIGQFLRGMLPRIDREPTLRGGFPHSLEHGTGEIREDDVVSEAGEMQSGVARASRHVEHAGAFRKRDVFQRRLDIGHIRKNVGAAIVAALAGELFLGGELDGIEFHGK
jgi:hypothetical protein